jgi:CRISPR-associated protein Csx10
MKKIPIAIELTTKAPLSIAQRRGVSNVLKTLDYIPGSVWRGALAQEFIRRNLGNDPEFTALFLQEQAWFGDLINKGGKVIPRTAMTCKYHGGFMNDNEYEDTHGVYDGLIPFLCHEVWQGAALPAWAKHCERCSQVSSSETPLDRFVSYYHEPNPTEYRKVEVRKSLIGHTQIHERWHVAEENKLYTIETIDAGQTFCGELLLDANASTTKLNQILQKQPCFWVGSDKTRGLGDVQLRKSVSEDNEAHDSLGNLKHNFNHLNEKLKKAGKELIWFALTLQSRVIVHDRFLRYKSCIEPEDLAEAYPGGRNIWANCHLVRGWNATCPVDGWNSYLGFPKKEETAIVPGSVFVFVADASAVNRDALCEALLEIQQQGIGLRRAEGFGRVTVCDAFHWKEVHK